MTGAPGLRGRQVRSLNRAGTDHARGLRHFRVARRIDQRTTGLARLARHRIPRRRLAVERQSQDLAYLRVRILRGRHALAIADRQEQEPTVGREGDLRAELSTPALRHVAPQHLQPLEARRAGRNGQPGPCDGQA